MFKKEKTVDSILSVFNKTITELTAHAESKTKEIEDLEVKIKEAESSKEAATIESSRAKVIIEKITAIVA